MFILKIQVLEVWLEIRNNIWIIYNKKLRNKIIEIIKINQRNLHQIKYNYNLKIHKI